MGIVSIISLLLPILTSALGTEGVIPSNLIGIVGTSATTLATLIAQLVAGKGSVTAESLAALQAVQTEINALKTAGAVFTLNQANEINALDSGISNAITAYENSLKTDDPSNLTPLPTTL
jgi:hypothetical protein